MSFFRHHPVLSTVTPERPSQHPISCLPAPNAPDGQTNSVRLGRLAHFASICRYSVCYLPRAAALLLTFCALFCASASGQTAHFVSAMSTLFTDPNNPYGVALDGKGDIYILENFTGDVLKETATADGYIQSVVANAANNGLSYPQGIAVDGNGNV